MQNITKKSALVPKGINILFTCQQTHFADSISCDRSTNAKFLVMNAHVWSIRNLYFLR